MDNVTHRPYLRDELLHYIEANGGITAASGARRDGRVRILLETVDHEHRSLFDQPAFP
ncbi:MAG: hypothetical protein R3C44_06950 [Chloroflexota bacterium]